MVRFIIKNKFVSTGDISVNLHSNMVRFIIFIERYLKAKWKLFTFQYG